MEIRRFSSLVLIVFLICSSCVDDHQDQVIPVVPKWLPGNEGGTIASAFKDSMDIVERLDDDERLVVGEWCVYDRSELIKKTESDDAPSYKLTIFPNHVVEISITSKQHVEILNMIGLWGIADGKVEITLYSYLWKSSVGAISPYSFELIDISKIDPLGYTKYRINPIVLSEELMNKTGVDNSNYRPYLYRILREYGGFGDAFLMPYQLKKMVETNMSEKLLVTDIVFLNEYWGLL